MATDYTVIAAVRQRFGDSPSGHLNSRGRDQDELPIEAEAPFVGKSKDFPFTCHAVDRGQMAVLQFNTLAVSGFDAIQINGVDVAGGISIGGYLPWFDPKMPFWSTHHLLIDANVLAEDNVLHIEAGAAGQAGGGTGIDDFILDNVVIWFKTVPSGRTPTQPTRVG